MKNKIRDFNNLIFSRILTSVFEEILQLGQILLCPTILFVCFFKKDQVSKLPNFYMTRVFYQYSLKIISNKDTGFVLQLIKTMKKR